jgi:hypothetical protein
MSENQQIAATPRANDSHLMSAEMTDPAWIRGVMSGLPVATAIQTPPGIVAITRRVVVEAGLDTLAVTRWLQPHGGFGAVAYLRPASHRLAKEPYRPALHPVSYFAVPVAALQDSGALTDAGEAPANSAVA